MTKTATHPPESPTTLEEWVIVNVESLQRSLGRTRMALVLVTMGLLVAIAAPYALGIARERGLLPEPAGAGEVRARQFVLTDADDRVRGTWGVDDAGVTRILLRDDAGVARLRISVLETGSPGMAFTDEAGRSRVVLGLLPDRSSSLVFADPTGATRAVLGLAPDQGATLVFADPAGQTRAGLGVDTQGRPTFLMTEEEEVPETGSGSKR
jgi:hypothetical protein